jgi:hydroxymethylpyrimidine/phosphomethylpyrimidine kinase
MVGCVVKRRQLPCALTIAGSDSGGGAGIQADLKTFAALKVHGASAITCLTGAESEARAGRATGHARVCHASTRGGVCRVASTCVKTGMLFSSEIIGAIATFLRTQRIKCPLIVDPVMIATSGALLLEKSAVKALWTRLLPVADLVTPNIPEAEMLADMSIDDPEDLRSAARKLHSRFGCAVLLKGGHLEGIKEALDIFYDGKTELLLRAPFVRGVSTHGTGCTYSAAIAAYCAQGKPLTEAVGLAKGYITRAIANSARVQSRVFWGGDPILVRHRFLLLCLKKFTIHFVSLL